MAVVRVENLTREMTEGLLIDAFSKCGDVECAAIEPEDRSFAFVYFKRAEDASSAVQCLQGVPVSGSNGLHIKLVRTGASEESGVHSIADKLRSSDLNSNLSQVLEGIFSAFNSGVMSASEAFEALNILSIHLKKNIKEAAHIWAHTVYERLLSKNSIERSLANGFLQMMKSKILPPTSHLAQTVAERIQSSLLDTMEKLAEVENYKVPVVDAWSWLIRLLGVYILEKRQLVNRMLKILEKSFTDKEVEVRIKSQEAWKAVVDILLPSQGKDNSDVAGGANESSALLTSKRMKLLMTPLVGTLVVEKSASSRNSCWKVCLYILQKIGYMLSRKSVIEFILVPMFESAFKFGRSSCNVSVWDSSACLFEEFLSLKVNRTAESEDTVKEISLIRWPGWKLMHLEFLLRIFGSLWKSYVADFASPDDRKLLLKYVLRIWHLILKGVVLDKNVTEEAVSEHQTAIYQVLHFISIVCNDIALLSGKDETKAGSNQSNRYLILSIWPLLEYAVLEMGPSVMGSSSFKVPLYPNSKPNIGTSILTRNSRDKYSETQLCKTVTPVSYITMIWLKFISDLGFDCHINLELIEKIEENLMLNIWMAFIEYHLGAKPEHTSDFLCYSQYERADQFPLSLLLFPSVLYMVLKAGEMTDSLENALQTVSKPVLDENMYFSKQFVDSFDIQCESINTLKLFNPDKYLKNPLEKEKSFKLTDNDSSKSCLVMAVQNTHTDICGRLVLYKLGETTQSFEVDDSNSFSSLNNSSGCKINQELRNLSYTLFLSAGFLKFASDSSHVGWKHSSTISTRVLEALISLSNSLHGPYERFFFVQILSRSLASLLSACLVDKNYSKEINTVEEGVEFMCSEKLEDFLEMFKDMISSLDNPLTLDYRDTNTSESCTLMALVARFLAIGRGILTENPDKIKESVSRVCHGLVCLSSHFRSQDDATAYMQALSNSLIDWFTDSKLSRLSSEGAVPMTLLEKIWDRMLASLQNCQPPLSFDSDLLTKQAPLLASAFQCSYKPIVAHTLLFWESTYGSKNSSLLYPSCFVPVLKVLQCKANITLPGFNSTFDSCHGLKPNDKNPAPEESLPKEQEPSSSESGAKKKGVATNGPGKRRKLRSSSSPSEPLLSDENPHACDTVTKYIDKINNIAEISVELEGPSNEDQLYSCMENSSIVVNNASSVETFIGRKVEERRSGRLNSLNYKPLLIRTRCAAKSDSFNTGDASDIPVSRNNDAIESDNSTGMIDSKTDMQNRKHLKRKERQKGDPMLKLLNSDLRTLGIRHLRNLRSVGGLRGGKNWRDTNDLAGVTPKIPTRQRQNSDIISKCETGELKSLPRSHSKSEELNELSSKIFILDTKTPGKEDINISLSELIGSDPSKQLSLESEEPTSESQFKVRGLCDGGLYVCETRNVCETVPPIKCSTDSASDSQKTPEVNSRHCRRKSYTPKRLTVNSLGDDMECNHTEDTVSAGQDSNQNTLSSLSHETDDSEGRKPLKRLKLGTENGSHSFPKRYPCRSRDNTDCSRISHQPSQDQIHAQMRRNLEQSHCLLKVNIGPGKLLVDSIAPLETGKVISREALSEKLVLEVGIRQDRGCISNAKPCNSQKEIKGPDFNCSSVVTDSLAEDGICNSNGGSFRYHNNHLQSKELLDIQEEIDKQLNVSDLLQELSSSTKIETLGKEDLLEVEKLVSALSNKITNRKKLLSQRK